MLIEFDSQVVTGTLDMLPLGAFNVILMALS